MDFNKLKITSGTYWEVFLHEDQTSIGRLYFWHKRTGGDLLECPKEELIEFHELGNKIKSALTTLFKPDSYNYLSLNNVTKHLHIHMIPRYSKKIELFGIVFNDSSFGRSYKRNPEFTIDEETLLKIKNKIKERLI